MRFSSSAKFHFKAMPHAKKILVCIGFFWIILLSAIFTLPITKSSTDFFPDNSPALQSMTKAMNMANFSQYIYVDFQAHGLSLEQLSKRIQIFEQSLNPKLLTPQKGQFFPNPQMVLDLLPSLFDAKIEQEFYDIISKENIELHAQNAQSLLLGFPSAGAMEWIRHDPLNLKRFILNRMPKNHALPPIDPRYGYALSNDSKHLLLILNPQKSIHDTHYALSAMNNIKQAIKELPPQIEVKVIGAIRHTVANTEAIDADILWISIVSLVSLIFIYFIFIRSIGAIWLLLTPCLAVSVALGSMHILFGLVSGLAVGFGMSILGIAEDYAVHMHFALRSNQDKNTVFNALSSPLFQGFLLNISGFALLLFSAIPAVRQLSVFAIIALGMGLVLALYILPLCPYFDKPKVIQKHSQNNVALFPKPLVIILLSTLLSLACICFFFLLPIDVSPRSLGAHADEIQNDSNQFLKTWQLASPSLILVEAKDSIQALQNTREIQSQLSKDFPETNFVSLGDILPHSKAIKENIARWNSFVAHNKLYINDAFSTSLKHLQADLVFAPFFDFLNRIPTPISLTSLQNSPWKSIVEHLLQNYPADNISQGRILADKNINLEQLSADIYKQVILFTPQSFEKSLRDVFAIEARYLPLMFIFCFVLLFICFRNVAQTLLAAMPAIAAIFCIFLTMLWWQKPLTLASLAAMPLVLGLAIDHGILATHHLAKGIALQMNKAILVSSLTACASMGMLAFATHPTLQAMGHVVFVGLLVEMPTALWLLPKLCKEKS